MLLSDEWCIRDAIGRRGWWRTLLSRVLLLLVQSRTWLGNVLTWLVTLESLVLTVVPCVDLQCILIILWAEHLWTRVRGVFLVMTSLWLTIMSWL